MFSQGSIREFLSKFFRIDSFIESLSGYLEARVELLKLEVRDDVANVISRAVVFVIIACLALLFILFFSLGIAIFLNRYFEENYTGFWIVAGFYLILVAISFAFRKQLFRQTNKFVKDHAKRKE
jgi:uncharacterized membrane protein YqjE